MIANGQILYMEVLRIVKFIEAECRRVVIVGSRCRGWGGACGELCLVDIEFQFSKMQKFLMMDGGDGVTTMGMYLVPLNRTVKMVNFMCCVLELDYKES